MDKIKKIWKELSIFAVVIVLFAGLFLFKTLAYGQYIPVTKNKVEEKMESKDSFVLVVGDSSQSPTMQYLDTIDTFVNENKSKDLFFLDLTKDDKAADFIEKTLGSDDIPLPQTFVVKDGVVEIQKNSALSYYRLNELFK